ncbi:MAG: hypothetical protein NVSMB13_04870 [Mycobacteriales bacterium]
MLSDRRNATRRWLAVGLATLVLVGLPSVVSAVPLGSVDRSDAATVLARVRSSSAVPYQGYAESHGILELPDVPQFGDLISLLGGTTRMRAWWSDSTHWRVDDISLANEVDTYRDPLGTWTWDSGPRRAVRVPLEPRVRLPRAADLLPPELGRRLAGAAHPEEVSRTGDRRIAGRLATGVRITPGDPVTTIGRIELWADRATGLPLRAEVTPRGADQPVLRTSFLDLRLRSDAPAPTFRPPLGSSASVVNAPDIASRLDELAPYLLPEVLAGLPRRVRIAGIAADAGTATYGDGYALMAVLPLPVDLTAQVLRRLEGTPATPTDIGRTTATALGIDTPLINALVVRAGRRGYLIAGTVAPTVLADAARVLVDAQPHRAPGR